MKRSRNIKLDLFRLLGLLVIMIAHAAPPGWLFQLRNFGTPLLIVASALTFSYIYSKREISSKPFYIKRLKRLIIPTWIFLTVFFLLVYLMKEIGYLVEYPFDSNAIIASYALYRGIGFVWIFKVYIILALITPLALRINSNTSSNRRYYSSLLIIYIIYELVVYFLTPLLKDQDIL